MLLYLFKKYFSVTNVIMSVILFNISINAMDAEVVSHMQAFFSVDKAVADTLILPQLNLQSLGRFARVCKTSQPYAFDKIYSTLPQDSACFNDLADSYSRCTKSLRYFSEQKNIALFQLLWSYHQVQREQEIQAFFNGRLDEFSLDVCMNFYRDNYQKVEKSRRRKEWNNNRNLKIKLRNGSGGVEELRDNNIEIATLFSRNNQSELFFILCKNTGDPDLLMSLAGEYITAHADKATRYLLKFRRLSALLTFIQSGIYDINTPFKSGKTILHCLNDGCCMPENWNGGSKKRCGDPVANVDWAITMGADVHAVDNKGRTCLHYACKSLHVKTVKRLLQENNIEVNKKDQKGKKSVDYINWLSSGVHDNSKTDKKVIKLLLTSYAPKQK